MKAAEIPKELKKAFLISNSLGLLMFPVRRELKLNTFPFMSALHPKECIFLRMSYFSICRWKTAHSEKSYNSSSVFRINP